MTDSYNNIIEVGDIIAHAPSSGYVRKGKVTKVTPRSIHYNRIWLRGDEDEWSYKAYSPDRLLIVEKKGV